MRATGPAFAATTAGGREVVSVDINPSHRIQSFSTIEAIGSTVDKEPAGTIPSIYSSTSVRAINDAGLGWLSYRLFTELTDEDWHWDPVGSFSLGDRGYWTSSASISTKPVTDSFGYRLPRRGNTTDQGGNEDYSRLDDGDFTSYWKSDPYLASAFTGDPDSMHPQWIVVDLGAKRPVNAMQIDWASPHATHYEIQYWTGSDPINDPANGAWTTLFADEHGNGGDPRLVFVKPPTTARFVRVVMSASSNTCDARNNADKRDCVGYAVREISVGRVDERGIFHDFVYHSPCGGEKPGTYACGVRQTATYVSSVDPWHANANRVRN